jgi:hypothetical protein
MTKRRLTVLVSLAVIVAGAMCMPAAGQVPAAYPTTGSPAYSIPTATYQPAAATQQPAAGGTYVAWSQPAYSPYQPVSQQQVACYSAPCAQAGCGNGDCGGQPNPYATPADSGCGCGYPAASCMSCQPPQAAWVAYAGGLLMSIDESHHHTFSFDSAHEEMQYTDWRNLDIEWQGGFEVALRRFGACSCTGLEVVYWGFYPGTTETSTYGASLAPGTLDGINNWANLYIDVPAQTADDYVNDAVVHRLRRDVEIHNAEINYLVLNGDTCNAPWRAEMVCGFRFFRFSDDMQFMADTVANDPILYDIDMDNTLVGAQIGGWGEYQLGCRLSVAGGAKVGVYNNHIKSYNRIGTAASTAQIGDGPYTDRYWCVDASKDDIALLSELQLAVMYQITPCWRASAGYRVVGVTGIATPTDQIYPDLRGINDVALVDSHGSLLLHGFTASIEFQF